MIYLCPRREAAVSNAIATQGANKVETVHDESGGEEPDWNFLNLCSPTLVDDLNSPDLCPSEVDSDALTQLEFDIDCPRGCGQAFTYTDLNFNMPCVCGSNM